MNFLLETANQGSSITLYILLGVLALFLISSYFISAKKRTQYMEKMKEMQNNFKVGVKVKTYAGMYGEIVSIREALDGSKVATIKSGDGENALTFEIDVQYILSVDEKDNEKVYDEEYEALKRKMEETTQDLNTSSLKVEKIETENTIDDRFDTSEMFEAKKETKKTTSKKNNKNKKD